MKRQHRNAIVLIIGLLILGLGIFLQHQHSKPTAVCGTSMVMHVLDVGQGDAIVVVMPDGKVLLVDAGPRVQAPTVLEFLRQNRISRIDWIVSTHPHEDHIGAMSEIINRCPVGQVYLPRAMTNTTAFEELLLTCEVHKTPVITARQGVRIKGTMANCRFLGPVADSAENLNNSSAVLRLQYGKISFLLTGDAQFEAEAELLQSVPAELRCTVMKIAHHGSADATSQSFLFAAAPKYAVISVGAGNDYGHPHEETLRRLARTGTEILRTDRDGTVTYQTDGENITVKKTSRRAASQSMPQGLIGNRRSMKLHRPDCASLPAPSNRVYLNNRDDAIRQGYTPCRQCQP